MLSVAISERYPEKAANSIEIANSLSVSYISLGGGALCTVSGADGSTTTLVGSQSFVPVGPPQRQISVSCLARST